MANKDLFKLKRKIMHKYKRTILNLENYVFAKLKYGELI